jgi:NAD(P)-dependent dehydrogenase (short-subunit alcohol dehydrogenase family)
MANVVITGCSSGFGLLTALLFARRGDRVFATLRTPAKAGPLTRAVETERLPITILPLDVCDPASVDAAVAAVRADAGRIDVVVNNAGIECRSSIEDADDEDVRRQFETNVFGPLRVIRAVLPTMRAQRAGTIVNVSSIAGIVSRPYGGLYSASKHALEAISEALHYEVQPFGIRVILVEPGQYGTSLLDNAYHGRRFTPASAYWEHSSRFDQALTRLRPEGRMGDPQEVAEIIHAAVRSPTPRLRHLAGQDAHMIADAYRQMDFEAYEDAMRRSLDWHD